MLPSMSARGCHRVGTTPGSLFPGAWPFIYLAQRHEHGEMGADRRRRRTTKSRPRLSALAAHKADFNVISGIVHPGSAKANGDGGGGHARASATYLTGAQAQEVGLGHPRRYFRGWTRWRPTRSGTRPAFPVARNCCDRGQEAGSCDSGYSCAYQFNISRRSETQPMNPEIEPKEAFDRLFGGGSSDESRARARLRRENQNKSVLDFVLGQTRDRQRGPVRTNTARKLDEYLTAIRDVESASTRTAGCPRPCPTGRWVTWKAEYTFERHMRLMFDMMPPRSRPTARASPASSSRTTAATGRILAGGSVGPPFHVPPRQQSGQAGQSRQDRQWHVTQFGYFLEKLKSVKEGNGTLLDNCMVTYGSGLADPNQHLSDNLPTILAGRGGGTTTPGRHLAADLMTNLYTALLDRAGVRAERFGDSTGRLEAIPPEAPDSTQILRPAIPQRCGLWFLGRDGPPGRVCRRWGDGLRSAPGTTKEGLAGAAGCVETLSQARRAERSPRPTRLDYF